MGALLVIAYTHTQCSITSLFIDSFFYRAGSARKNETLNALENAKLSTQPHWAKGIVAAARSKFDAPFFYIVHTPSYESPLGAHMNRPKQ